MSLITETNLGSHTFTGPFTDNSQLAELSGVYMITTIAANGKHTVLDVGESHNIKTRISSHDRTSQWRSNAINGVYAWVHHCDGETRMLLESTLRQVYQPVCGDR